MPGNIVLASDGVAVSGGEERGAGGEGRKGRKQHGDDPGSREGDWTKRGIFFFVVVREKLTPIPISQ